MTIGRLLLVNLTVWWKSSARLVGSRAKRNAVVVTAGASWIVWLYVASRSSDRSSPDIGATADRQVFDALTLLVVGVGWMSSAIANLYVTARPVLDMVVAVMPVSAFQRAVTDRLLPAALAAVGSMFVLAPVLWPLIDSLGTEFPTGWSLLTLITLLGTGSLLGQLTHVALFAGHLRLRPAGMRMMHERAGVLSATIAIGVLVWAYASISHGDRPFGPMRVVTTVAAPAAGGAVVHVVAVVALLAITVLLLFLAARLASEQNVARPVDRTATTLRSLTSRPARRTALLRLESALWFRDRFNRGTLVALALGTVTTVVAWARGADAGVVVLLVSSLMSVAALAGASSYGSTRRWHWVYVVAGRHSAWVWPKLASIAAVWWAMALTVATVAVLTGAWRADEVAATIGVSSLPLFTVTLVGLAIPASSQHSMQSLTTLFASLCVSTATLPVLLSIPVLGQSGWSILLLGAALATGVAGAYRRNAVGRPHAAVLSSV